MIEEIIDDLLAMDYHIEWDKTYCDHGHEDYIYFKCLKEKEDKYDNGWRIELVLNIIYQDNMTYSEIKLTKKNKTVIHLMHPDMDTIKQITGQVWEQYETQWVPLKE